MMVRPGFLANLDPVVKLAFQDFQESRAALDQRYRQSADSQ